MDIEILLWSLPNLIAFVLLTVFIRLSSRIVAYVSLGLIVASLPFAVVIPDTIGVKVLAFVLSLWGVIVPARLLFGRQFASFLQSSTFINALFGFGAVFVLTMYYMFAERYLSFEHYALYFSLISIVASSMMFAQLFWSLRHYKIPNSRHVLSDLPTVSLCIAARNEDHALQECLALVVASDYPKLEILVYDDESRDSTSQVIRNFAQNGVRFIQGVKPAEGWLGKNQAMLKLSEQAVGEYLIFMSVDTHMEPDSLSKLIEYAIYNKHSMISVLPKNRSYRLVENLFNTLHNYWQVALPISSKHVPTSTKFWLIARKELVRLGGFDAVKSKAVPEAYFARKLFSEDKYRFLVGTLSTGISTAKKWSSQVESSIRTFYPICRRRPMLLLSAGISIFVVFVVPILLVGLNLFFEATPAYLPYTLAAIVLMFANYMFYLFAAYRSYRFLSLIFLPYSVMQELVLAMVSMLKYEFGTVNWKGRNVGFPASFREQLKNKRI